MSVNESPQGMPQYRRPPSFGGTAKNLRVFRIGEEELPPELSYRLDPEMPGHGFVEPSFPMPFSDYQDLIGGTQLFWTEVIP